MNGKGVAFLGPGSCVLFSDDTPNLKLRRLPLPWCGFRIQTTWSMTSTNTPSQFSPFSCQRHTSVAFNIYNDSIFCSYSRHSNKQAYLRDHFQWVHLGNYLWPKVALSFLQKTSQVELSPPGILKPFLTFRGHLKQAWTSETSADIWKKLSTSQAWGGVCIPP